MAEKTFVRLFALILLALFAGGRLEAQAIDVYRWPVQYQRSHDYDVQHYRIHLTIDKDKRSFWYRTRIP